MSREEMFRGPTVRTDVTTVWSDGDRLRTDSYGRTFVLPHGDPIRLCTACWAERAAAIGGGRSGLGTCEHTTALPEVLEVEL